jgi:flagellar hook-length control protein FliK
MGALPQLETLLLSRNEIGDIGISALASACASGALASLKELWLQSNQIGDVGMQALAGAVSSGALASLKELIADDGPLGVDHPKLKAACQSRGITLR